MSSPKTILFLGATGGVAFSTLRRSLAAGHTCIALCRTPDKLVDKLASSDNSENKSAPPSNLRLEQGNALDADALVRCLLDSPSSPSRPVDAIVFSVGARPTLRGVDDPHVCENSMAALLTALRRRRDDTNNALPAGWKPRLIVVSSTGISTAARDIPLLMVPLYRTLLHTPHEDKRAMERLAMASGEEWTLIRGSLYTDGPETDGLVREGMEDPVRNVVESSAVGYTISREDLGKWVFENCIQGGEKWIRKAATVTY